MKPHTAKQQKHYQVKDKWASTIIKKWTYYWTLVYIHLCFRPVTTRL